MKGFEGFKDSRVQEGFKIQEFKKDSRVQEGFKEFKSSRLKLRSSLQDVAVPQLQLRHRAKMSVGRVGGWVGGWLVGWFITKG